MSLIIGCLTLLLIITSLCIYFNIYLTLAEHEKNIFKSFVLFDFLSTNKFLSKIENIELRKKIDFQLKFFRIFIITTVILSLSFSFAK